MKIAYFTGGTIGAGHLARGIAILRGLMRSGCAATYQMFGPKLPYQAADSDNYQAVDIRPEELQEPLKAAESALALALEGFHPDLLLVDMFWAPLRYILPRLKCESWLLIRSCPIKWFFGSAEKPFAPEQFRRIIGIEPLHHLVVHQVIDPIVVCNPDECKPRTALREHLRVPSNQPLVVVTQAGLPGECEALCPKLETGELFRFNMLASNTLFPLCEWLTGADAIYCGTGYNSFWEAQWLGYASRTHFTPFGRHIDDQAWRLTHCQKHTMRENGADILARWIRGS